MILFKQAAGLSTYITEQKKEGKIIGFVPTMGALHAGHLSLIDAAGKDSSLTVCSIFVNPTQFNNAEDFKHYPVTIEKDIEQLVKAGCDVLFLPPVAEVYPPGYVQEHYPLGYLETVLEGAHRPGHFQGVCGVVNRLLQIVAPDHLYLGQKDYQQCMVLQKLVTYKHNGSTHIHFVPTLRERDGLAMSSRNLRLTAGQREQATEIYRQLSFIRDHHRTQPFPQLEAAAAEALAQKGFVVDYVSIRNGTDLSPAGPDDQRLIVLAAAAIGPVRLIDNILLSRH